MEIINNYNYILNKGLKIKTSSLLPYDETVNVWNIETREEVTILTGKKINCIKINNELIVSDELYKQLLNI